MTESEHPDPDDPAESDEPPVPLPDEPATPEPLEGPDGDEEEIDDDLDEETIKYYEGETILGVTLDGPKVGHRSIDVFTFGEFLAQLDRVVRALTAAAEGIALASTGKIPRPPDAAPWRASRLRYQDSATIEFVLGQPEVMTMANDGSVTSPTIEAVVRLAELVGLGPEEAVVAVSAEDDRIGTDFSALLGLLADNNLTSKWITVRDSEQTIVEDVQADRVRAALRQETEPLISVVNVTGFLFRLDARRNDFKIQPEEGPAVTGSYSDELIGELRDSWSHRVVAELTRTEHRYAYASTPHRIDHSLKRIVTKLAPADPD